MLRVEYSCLLDPTLNTSPKPHLRNALPCRHPCHTWDLGPGVNGAYDFAVATSLPDYIMEQIIWRTMWKRNFVSKYIYLKSIHLLNVVCCIHPSRHPSTERGFKIHSWNVVCRIHMYTYLLPLEKLFMYIHWTGRVLEVTGWRSRLQENCPPFERNIENIPTY